MSNYTYVTFKINNISGEVEIMNTKNVKEKEKTIKDIYDVYKLLNIPIKDDEKCNNYKKVTRYDYNQKSLLDINTYAKI